MAQQEHSFKYKQVSSMSRPTVPISSHEFSALIFSDTQGNCDAESVSPLLPSLSVLYPFDCDLPSLFEMSSHSPELDLFLGDPFGNPLSFFCTQNPGLSPTTSSVSLEVDDVVFGGEGINDNQPLLHAHDAVTHSQVQLQKLQPNEFLHLDRNSVTSTGSNQEREEQNDQQQPTQAQTKKQRANSRSNRKTKTLPPAPFAKNSVRSRISKNTHNMVEKRYRVNINDKMIALRDAVPSMSRIVEKKDNLQAATVEHEKALDIIGEENGLKQTYEIGQPKNFTRLTVLSKATILIMATEYVTQLETKNAELLEENADLKERFREIDVASIV